MIGLNNDNIISNANIISYDSKVPDSDLESIFEGNLSYRKVSQVWSEGTPMRSERRMSKELPLR